MRKDRGGEGWRDIDKGREGMRGSESGKRGGTKRE